MTSQRLVTALVISNIIGMQLGALAPQQPSRLNSAVSLLLLMILSIGAVVAGLRMRMYWFRDALRDVVVGQGVGWALGLAIVGIWGGGLSSPKWLAAFAPIFCSVCALVTALIAPLAHWFVQRRSEISSPT